MRKYVEAITHGAKPKRPATRRRHALALDLFTRFLRAQQPKGALAVSLLSMPTLSDFASWLRKAENGLHGRKRGDGTVQKIAEVVEVFWEWAEGQERWPDVPRPRKLHLPKPPPQPVYAPTWAQMDAAIYKASGWQRKLMTWLRYTGLRVGESMLFLWSDVDLERGTLTIRRDLDKMSVARVVPLSPHLIAEIETWAPEVGKREGWLIPSGRCVGPRERQARQRDTSLAWKRSGAPAEIWKQRPDHTFRKGFKTGLLALGKHPDAIDFLQGHIDASSRSRYIDASQLPLKETIAAVPKIAPPSTGATVVELPQRRADKALTATK